MSKVAINNTSLSAIGEAIRSKTGSTDLLLPSEMPVAINGIQSGGSQINGIKKTGIALENINAGDFIYSESSLYNSNSKWEMKKNAIPGLVNSYYSIQKIIQLDDNTFIAKIKDNFYKIVLNKDGVVEKHQLILYLDSRAEGIIGIDKNHIIIFASGSEFPSRRDGFIQMCEIGENNQTKIIDERRVSYNTKLYITAPLKHPYLNILYFGNNNNSSSVGILSWDEDFKFIGQNSYYVRSCIDIGNKDFYTWNFFGKDTMGIIAANRNRIFCLDYLEEKRVYGGRDQTLESPKEFFTLNNNYAILMDNKKLYSIQITDLPPYHNFNAPKEFIPVVPEGSQMVNFVQGIQLDKNNIFVIMRILTGSTYNLLGQVINISETGALSQIGKPTIWTPKDVWHYDYLKIFKSNDNIVFFTSEDETGAYNVECISGKITNGAPQVQVAKQGSVQGIAETSALVGEPIDICVIE